MSRRRPPQTAAGYYVLHDFRRIDWASWRALSESEREERLEGAIEFFERGGELDEGDLALYSIHGHKADLLLLAMGPTLRDLDTFERRFEQLGLAEHTRRTTSALGVTEASGYTEAAASYFDPDEEADPGIERYMETRLYPSLPETDFLTFYFMDKRRHPDANWYDLPYEERAEHVARHGEIGKEFAGAVTQLITGTIGFDDYEWGVTLFTDDMVAVKDLLTAMRFDPSTSRFAEFGPFYVGDRFLPAELPAFLAGEPLTGASEPEPDTSLADELDRVSAPPTLPKDAFAVLVASTASKATVADAVDELRGSFDHYDSHLGTDVTERDGDPVVVSGWETQRAAETAAGFLGELPGVQETQVGPVGQTGETTSMGTDDEAATAVRSALEDADVYAGQPHGEDVHALVRFSANDPDVLDERVSGLRESFDRYETHVGTDCYEANAGDRTAVVSIWETADAAETAGGYLADLPGVTESEEEEGFATMGLFYRVDPAHRTDFVETFESVAEVLAGLEGHRETDLMINVTDENDMFIASRWRDKDAAMTFFRSEEFRETVQWGRDILTDRPRHVFLA